MTLPSVPRVPTSTLPSADLIETTDRIDTGRGETPTETDDLGQPPTEAPRFPEISELARKIADFAPGMAGRIQDYVTTTARAGLLMVLILLMACGQGPVQVGPDPGQAQPVIVPAAPAPVPAAAPPKTPAPPSRLKLPTVWVEVDGVKIHVGPLHDQDTGKDCTLQVLPTGDALCVPTDTVRVEPAQTGYLDIDCTVPVARTQGAIEAFDGARVWRSLMGQPAIPDGTATIATRDQAGACKPARVIMAGGWAFTAGPTPAQLLYALVRRALD